jgi:hypothetical protein
LGRLAAVNRNPPREIVEETDPSNPANVERRDYLRVEKEAWAAHRRVGDIPVTIVTVEYSDAAVRESPFPSERAAMRDNVERSRRAGSFSARARGRRWCKPVTPWRRTIPIW